MADQATGSPVTYDLACQASGSAASAALPDGAYDIFQVPLDTAGLPVGTGRTFSDRLAGRDNDLGTFIVGVPLK